MDELQIVLKGSNPENITGRLCQCWIFHFLCLCSCCPLPAAWTNKCMGSTGGSVFVKLGSVHYLWICVWTCMHQHGPCQQWVIASGMLWIWIWCSQWHTHTNAHAPSLLKPNACLCTVVFQECRVLNRDVPKEKWVHWSLLACFSRNAQKTLHQLVFGPIRGKFDTSYP